MQAIWVKTQNYVSSIIVGHPKPIFIIRAKKTWDGATIILLFLYSFRSRQTVTKNTY
ncbi:hypothetical protein Hanom_Chr14g01301291 [Helianthus anomalus]